MKNGISYSEELLEDKLRVKATSSITFSPTKRHHLKTLTCLTHNPALNEPLATRVKLKVEYPPEIDLIMEPSKFYTYTLAIVTDYVFFFYLFFFIFYLFYFLFVFFIFYLFFLFFLKLACT